MSICLHAGANLVTREELAKIPAPECTRTWHPVKHIDLVESIEREAKNRNIFIKEEKFGVTPDGNKLFGWLQLQPNKDVKDFTRAIGFRHSNDKQMAIRMMAGVSVFVCDNMAMTGGQAIRRKHTGHLYIDVVVHDAFSTLDGQFEHLLGRISEMKDSPIRSRTAVYSNIMQTVENGAIPSCDALSVLNMWDKPLHPEFEPRTSWSLYNCYNEVAKKYSPSRQAQCFNKLAEHFCLDRIDD